MDCGALDVVICHRDLVDMSRRGRSRSEGQVSGDEDASADQKIARLPSAEERRFGDHVRRLRRARGLTQERLAELSELSPDTIRRLEHGSFSPSLDTLTKLCVGLNLARSTLFECFELGDRDLIREFVDLLVTRTPREIERAFRMVQVMFDEADDREPSEREGEASLEVEVRSEESDNDFLSESCSWLALEDSAE